MVAEMIEDIDWESDESEDWESDEAFAETEDSAEDIGERARRRRQQRRYYRPGRGVQGITVRGRDGSVQRVPFPTKLATAAETNRGLASQELARRALAGRLERLEARSRAMQKKDSSISGLVTLAIGGSLTAFGAIQAGRNSGSGTGIQKWADQTSTKTAAVVSASQLATSGAKLVINGRYHRSGIGMAADIFSAAQLAAFTFGALHTPDETRGAQDIAEARRLKEIVPPGTLIVIRDTGTMFRVVSAGNERLLGLVSGGSVEARSGGSVEARK